MKYTRVLLVMGVAATFGLAACGDTGTTNVEPDATADDAEVNVGFGIGDPPDVTVDGAAGGTGNDGGTGGGDASPATDTTGTGDDTLPADTTGASQSDAATEEDAAVEGPDVPDGPECVEESDCVAILGDLIVQCTRPGCVAGECVVLPIVSCCQSVEECEGALNLDACEQAACVDQQCIKAPSPNCCTINDHCAFLADGCCTEAHCGIDNQCKVETKDSCCAVDAHCDDGIPLTDDTCEAACETDGCLNVTKDLCTEQSQPVAKDFDDGSLQLLTAIDADPSDAVGIHASKLRRVSGSHSVYFGDPSCETYFNGPIGAGCDLPSFSTPANTSIVNLELGIPQFSLGAEDSYFLGFWINMAAEPAITITLPDGEQVLDVDWLQVVVDDGSGADIVWRSTDPDALGAANTTNGDWLYQVANLGAYSGKALSVTFNFVTDNASNFNEVPGGAPWYGVYLDDIVVSSVCAPLTCAGDGDTCTDDLDACTSDACTGFAIGGGGVCGYQTATPGSDCKGCVLPTDCGSDTACFDYTCNAGICASTQKSHCCQPSSTFPTVTLPGEVALEGFEDGDLEGWTVTDDLDDNVGWQVTTILTYNGDHSLYFGDSTTQTYVAEPTNPARATAWTPLFEVPATEGTKGVASFWLWMSTEYDGVFESPIPPPTANLTYDQLRVWLKGASPSATPTEVWSSAAVGNNTGGDWRQIGVDLSNWAGQDVRLGFDFDSGEAPGQSVANNFGGVRIDDLTVTSTCASECLSFTECIDEDFCTAEHCELGECVSIKPDPDCCFVDEDCDDDNTCSVDECTNTGCLHYYDDSSEAKLACCDTNGASWLDSWEAGFEDGDLTAWTTAEETLPIMWHVTDTTGSDGSSASANFADPATGTFDNGGDAAFGLLISPPIDVPPLTKGTPYAQFDILLSTEWDVGDPNQFYPQFVVDDLTVSVAIEGYLAGAVEMWDSNYLLNTTQGTWLRTRLDLSDYRDLTVELVFEFDSGDHHNNEHSGPFIDNVGFATTCLPDNAIQCLNGGDCTPDDDCKVVSCSDDFKCLQAPKPTPECCEPFLISELTFDFEGGDFEGGSDGWESLPCESGGAPDDASAVWQFADGDSAAGIQAKVGDGMLYFGNGTALAAPEFGGCDEINSPCVALEDGVPWTVSMWVFLDIEKDIDCIGGGAGFSDQVFIKVQDCAGEAADELVFAKFDVECSEYDKWVYQEFEVDAWAGESMRLQFGMDTWDAFINDGKGVAIDQVEFTRGCGVDP